MNYKIILTSLTVVSLLGVLIVFAISRSVSTPAEVKMSVKENAKTAEKETPVAINSNNQTAPPIAETITNSTEKSVQTIAPESTEMMPQNVPMPDIKPEVKTAAVNNDVFNGEKIVKSEAEWKKILTAEQFYVLREKGTEKPYTGKYTDNKEKGTYTCGACHLALFSSKNKFDSETGWISFYKPIVGVNVLEEEDKSLEETRTEVLCARCGSHLGHVFDDGPEPTGLRYCINSAALGFKKHK